MAETKIDSAEISNLKGVMKDFSVSPEETDGANEVGETFYDNTEWGQNLGYYNTIPELGAVIDVKATWTVGKGFIADEVTTLLLNTIIGNGTDTFNTILENNIRTYYIGGDSFNEIITIDGERLKDDGTNLLNLKPLDPGTMRNVANPKGRIIRFEKREKVGDKMVVEPFEPHEIFYLPRNRVADEIHGKSMINKLRTIILMRNEAMEAYKEVMLRYMKPRYIFHLDSDDATENAAFKVKMDNAWKDGENIYVPKDVVVPELMAVAPNATLNPQTWIDNLNDYFFEASAVPKVIVGGTGGITEAAVKIAYLAFQQTIEEEQLFIEEQVLAQLGLVIKLEFPASLENELLSDKTKDGAENIDASETTAGEGQ